MDMNSGNRIWCVSVRSKKDGHRVEASSVKEDDGRLILTDAQGNLAGSFYLTEVQGYSVEPVAPVFTRLEERLNAARRRVDRVEERQAKAEDVPVPAPRK
jgi:hypothetical protein